MCSVRIAVSRWLTLPVQYASAGSHPEQDKRTLGFSKCQRRYGLVVMTQDSESCDPSSTFSFQLGAARCPTNTKHTESKAQVLAPSAGTSQYSHKFSDSHSFAAGRGWSSRAASIPSRLPGCLAKPSAAAAAAAATAASAAAAAASCRRCSYSRAAARGPVALALMPITISTNNQVLM